MKLPPTRSARFVRRENRFRVTVELAGEQMAAHLPNSGRLEELLIPGRTAYVAHRPADHRRTDYDLLLVDHAGVLVSVDARLPNPLFAEGVETGQMPPFSSITRLEKEVQHGNSRLDFRLHRPRGAQWVETKSVTLVEDGLALFPDAPTLRGQRHVQELTRLAEQGDRAAVVFVVQRPDAARFTPHGEADPAFAQALADAARAGVEVHAFRCHVTRESLRIADQIPVSL